MAHIQTERLKLRPFIKADSEQVMAILNDFDVSKWLHRIPHPFTQQDLRILGPKGESRWPDLAAIEHDGALVGALPRGRTLVIGLIPNIRARGLPLRLRVPWWITPLADRDVTP